VLKLTNLNKVLWPVEGYTKADLIDYYRTVAPVILPYLRDRPQSLHRHPDGIDDEGFYQKDVRDPPPWVQTVHLRSRSTERPINYLLCQDEATLVYLANLACIELNPWFSRVDALDRPDFLVVDLDTDVAPFAMMVETALIVRKTLDDAGATGVCKTSGKKGLHIYVPLGARYDYDQAVQFAELLARMVHAQLPQTTSMERSPEKRRGLVYPDYLQNRRGQTIAAPYSVRPFPGATVSTPLRWQEVKRGLDPAAFTIRTVPPRLDKLGDLWAPVLGPGVDILGCIERLARVTMPRQAKG
jgi:bifunctional non-homologous end joining protein LigD